jgi:uncharacterized cupredoxin-like copper-binding protein
MRRVRSSISHPRSVLLGSIVALSVLLAACGSSGGGSGSKSSGPITATGGKVTIVANDIYFNTKEIDASPGALAVTLKNDGSQLHTFVIQGQNFKLSASGHTSKTGTVNLPAGTYTFFCDVPGHRSAGMVGQLVVK